MLKKILFTIIYFTFIHVIVREVFQRKRITIVYFHHLPKNYAKKILSYYKKYFNIIALKDYVDTLNGNAPENFKIPNKALIITIDDGLKQNYELLPILKELKIPLTIFGV